MNSEIMRVTEANFVLYAAKHYDADFPDTEEFNEDLKRFAYVKRLFNTYISKQGELKDRLIFNHLTIIFNCWNEHAVPMLFVRLNGYETLLNTFLTFMQRMPPVIKNVGLDSRTIIAKDLEIDPAVIKILNERLAHTGS